MNTQKVQLEQQSLLSTILRNLADVADGKLTLDEAIKQTTNDAKEIKQIKTHYNNLSQIVSSLKKNTKKEIKNALLTNEFEHKYETKSALSIRDDEGNITSFIGGTPKKKQSFWNKIKSRFARSLRQNADFIDGKISIKEFAQTPYKNLHQDYMEDFASYRKATGIIRGINKGIKQSIAELRGTTTPQGHTQSPTINPYTNLDQSQLNVALGTAYENIVRIQHNGTRSDQDKTEILNDFQQLISAADKYYPRTQTTSIGSYFTDKEVAATESQLFSLLKEASKTDSLIAQDVNKYEMWRDNKNFEIKSPTMNLTEYPYHNSARYSHQDSSNFHTIHTLKSPLKAGQNTMSAQALKQAKLQISKISVR